MTDNNTLEKGAKAYESPESQDSKKTETKRFDENTPDVGTSREATEALTGVEAHEEVESVNARVSESLKEGKDSGGNSGSGQQITSGDINEIKARLLKNSPSEKVMKKQIEVQIEKEIKYLHRKAIKMIGNPSSMSFFELANILKKIRDLRGILIDLAKASVGAIKTLWLRFVHGVM